MFAKTGSGQTQEKLTLKKRPFLPAAGMIKWITSRLLDAELRTPKYHGVARHALAEREATHRAITFAEFVGACGQCGVVRRMTLLLPLLLLCCCCYCYHLCCCCRYYYCCCWCS
jgi:hypothetical protein